MNIRRYENNDLDTLSKLFFETVHSVNSADYTAEQLFAWAKDADTLKTKRGNLESQKTLLAEIDGMIVGFGSVDKYGCLDFLFVHKDYQRKGIATALCDELEKDFSAVKTFASITAKPFFESRGYVVVKEQEVERFGVKLKNYEMKKICKTK